VNLLRQLPIILLLALLCAHNAVAAEYFPPKRTVTTNEIILYRSITVHPPEDQPKISLANKLNPIWWFKNVDEPTAPDDYLPHHKFRNVHWLFRNSFHNFTFYVIGVADKTFVRSGRNPDKVFRPGGGVNFAVTKYGILRLPFLSYERGLVHAYIGWRDRGNFGMKLNFGPRKENKAKANRTKPTG